MTNQPVTAKVSNIKRPKPKLITHVRDHEGKLISLHPGKGVQEVQRELALDFMRQRNAA